MGGYEVRESNVDNGLSDFPEVLEDGVNKIKTLKDTRGHDGISAEVSKLWPAIGVSVTSLIKAAIDQRAMSNVLKVSTMIPIQKVKGGAKCCDLRPINTLPISY